MERLTVPATEQAAVMKGILYGFAKKRRRLLLILALGLASQGPALACEEDEIALVFESPSRIRVTGCPSEPIYLSGASPFDAVLVQRKRDGVWEPRYEYACAIHGTPPVDWSRVASWIGPRGYGVDPGTYRYVLVFTTIDPTSRPASEIPCMVVHSVEFEVSQEKEFVRVH